MAEFKKKSYSNSSSDDKLGGHVRRPLKKKVCSFCVEKTTDIDYKDLAKLRKFVTEKGKILPRRQTGVCAKHQRELAVAIRRARVMALLPFDGE